MADEMRDTAQTNVESDMSEEIEHFRTVVNIIGLDHFYGLAKSDNESEGDFKKRIIERMTAIPKTKQEYNNDLFAFLKNHFLERLCWWNVSNGGDDFEIEMTDNGTIPASIILKIYPSGKPLLEPLSADIKK